MLTAHRRIWHWMAGLLMGFATISAYASGAGAPAAQAQPDPSIPYYQWYEVTLPADSGADCGNGTPYRFYINRAPSKNLLFTMEPGGACFDYGMCTNTETGPAQGLGAFNPDGIPQNYMSGTFNESLLATFLSPLMTRINLTTILVGEPRVETQDWNQVFLPYCTGDIHMGSAIRTYTSPDGSTSRVQHFNGLKNAQVVTQWLVDHGFGKPDRLMVYGLSAGGFGTLSNYAFIHDTLQPQVSSSALSDAGTLFNTRFDDDPIDHPSVYLYRKVAAEWDFAAPDGLFALASQRLKGFDPSNLSSIYTALSQQYPHDRFGLSTYQQDKIIAAYHYRPFIPSVIAAPDDASKDAAALALFDQELPGIQQVTAPLPNFGYYMPWARSDFINNHMVTAVSFSGSNINENGIDANVSDFVNDLLSQQDPALVPVMKVRRTQRWSDFSFSTFLSLIDSIFNLTGDAGGISGHKS
ncbi:pectinacetylesterase family protein [Dyella tabacisoli]|nr:pectinacetylesterase family protein [Dyella tabacisoli]